MALQTGPRLLPLKALTGPVRYNESALMERPRATALLSDIRSAAQQQREETRQRVEKLCEAAAEAVAEGFSTLSTALAERAHEALEQEREAGRKEGRRETASALLAVLRRMQGAEDRGAWLAAVADGAALFAERCAIFLVRGEYLDAADGRGFPEAAGQTIVGTRVHLSQAAAFRHAIEAAEPVIAQRTRSELSESLAAWLGPGDGRKAWLVPVRQEETAIAVLYAEGEPEKTDAPGLELIAMAAGWTARERAWSSAEEEAGKPLRRPRELPDWSSLSRRDQQLHLEAQRFARVQVAELRLHHEPAVRAGRAERKLYARLKSEIDRAREAFRRQFIDASPTMIDYLHRELVRTLAHDEPDALGTEYPGPLV